MLIEEFLCMSIMGVLDFLSFACLRFSFSLDTTRDIDITNLGFAIFILYSETRNYIQMFVDTLIIIEHGKHSLFDYV